MFGKIWLCAFGEMGKLKDIEYISRHASLEFCSKFSATTFLLYFLVDFISVERKQDTFNTQQIIIQTGRAKCCLFRNALKLTNSK
jgi:hypothetical protein